ncbi:hypothetical protein, partial [Pseudoalteromonas distincta]
ALPGAPAASAEPADAVRATAASFAAAASTAFTEAGFVAGASVDGSAHGPARPAETPPAYGLGDGIPGSASASFASGGSGPAAARLDDRAGAP